MKTSERIEALAAQFKAAADKLTADITVEAEQQKKALADLRASIESGDAEATEAAIQKLSESFAAVEAAAAAVSSIVPDAPAQPAEEPVPEEPVTE